MTFKTTLGDQFKQFKSESSSPMKYLIYDIESIVDKKLLKQVAYAHENLTDEQAYARHLEDQIKNTGKSFPNAVFHVPVCLAVLSAASDFTIQKIGLLGHDDKTPAAITKHFWDIYNTNPNMTLVDFNGSGYDMRLMELWAFREAIAITPQHFQKFGARYRFAEDRHLDLQDSLNNNGAIRYMGGLDLLAKVLGKPGKMETKGEMVQELHNAGKLFEIEDYCLGDVLDTYFVFLRWMVVQGRLNAGREKELVNSAFEKIREHGEKTGYLKKYLAACAVQSPTSSINS